MLATTPAPIFTHEWESVTWKNSRCSVEEVWYTATKPLCHVVSGNIGPTDNPTTQSRHASSVGKSGVYWQISLCEAAVYNPRLCFISLALSLVCQCHPVELRVGKERKREGRRRRGRDKGLEKERERRRKRKASVVVVEGIAGCSFKAFTTRNSTSCFLTLIFSFKYRRRNQQYNGTTTTSSKNSLVSESTLFIHFVYSDCYGSTGSLWGIRRLELMDWTLWTWNYWSCASRINQELGQDWNVQPSWGLFVKGLQLFHRLILGPSVFAINEPFLSISTSILYPSTILISSHLIQSSINQSSLIIIISLFLQAISRRFYQFVIDLCAYQPGVDVFLVLCVILLREDFFFVFYDLIWLHDTTATRRTRRL